MLRVSDLLDWIASPKEIQWDRGLKGVCEADCKPLPEENSEAMEHQYDKGLNEKFSPGHSEFLSDVRQEKETIGNLFTFMNFVGHCGIFSPEFRGNRILYLNMRNFPLIPDQTL